MMKINAFEIAVGLYKMMRTAADMGKFVRFCKEYGLDTAEVEFSATVD